MSQRLLILGTGDHAAVSADTARAMGLTVAGFLGSSNLRAPPELYIEGGATDAGVVAVAAKTCAADACFAGFGDNATRRDALDAAAHVDMALASLIHPTAYVDPAAEIADGIFIGTLARVITGARLERGALINSAALIDHDCRIGTCAAVYSGAILGGRVTLGPLAAIGLNATVLPGRTIGEGCVVGAGAVVTRDQAALTVVIGAPGKAVRARAIDEPYIS